jgi:hypothetical protein
VPTLSPKSGDKGGAPVIFQQVVPFFAPREDSSSRLGAKVQISRIDLQGTDLSRRLLHRVPPHDPFDC